ncbi:hypothetical protein D3C71_1878000 [compost metagenome]
MPSAGSPTPGTPRMNSGASTTVADSDTNSARSGVTVSPVPRSSAAVSIEVNNTGNSSIIPRA